ncbi:FAD/NAD(P)-binding oxidoreductase [Longispora fulva]|uniref:Assimilatory nitrate reductase electron transfer subunit n=1 Tax=Longispora fulva TaxID=619741 RepID=A0A8J7GKW5_9ACTN|nr:FAD-dependent oxidoreductase [Longispora fulva]MBG6141489.1 assimilatory nitrate reductase electron transfer subunit [Longispora fulva]GIG59361.1 FAD/NAD(P)-binding oxidoreductase [Longispora fulva]
MRITIIGYGMAGARLATLLAREHDVTVYGAEPHAAYNRILLSGLLAGAYQETDLALPASNVDLRLGVTAIDVDRVARTVDGEPYDALVLATGSRAIIPPIKGLTCDDGDLHPNVAAFRTLEDCRRILSATGSHPVVLGGGLLGVEAARGLAGRGPVTLVHGAPHLLERQLDPAGGAVLADTLAAMGITVRVDAQAVAYADGVLRLADGTELPADPLVVSCGVRAETTLAESIGLAVGRGVLVDDELRASDPDIYAIGDCAEHRNTVYGLVAPAWEQAAVLAGVLGEVAAARSSGARPGDGSSVRYTGSRLVTRLKAAGIDLAAMGHLDGEENLSFTDPSRGTYARLAITDGRLRGAILIGDNPTVGTITQLFDRRTPVPADRRSLLLGRISAAAAPAETPALMPDAAVVCRCNTVTKGDIVRCGGRTVPQIAERTNATTGCGGCTDAVRGIADWLSTVDPVMEEV